jgi:hypothetical protein
MWPEWHHKMKLLFDWKEYRDGKLVVMIYDQMNWTVLSTGLLSVCLEKTGVLAGNLKYPSQLVGTTVPHD